MRLWVAVIAALIAQTALVAQTAGAAQVCTAGDGRLIDRACYSDAAGPVGYDHPILGATPEWTDVSVYPGKQAQGLKPWALRFDHGFIEDIAPRLADVDGDGLPEIIVVQTDLTLGARLVVLSRDQQVMGATAYIGQRHRWLAPAGVGDFDGDGRVEIAYVDRPHLAKELVLVRYQDGRLVEVGRYPDFANHRIGDAHISGGVRHCGGKDSLVLADGNWQRVIEVQIVSGQPQTTDRGAMSAQALARALTCG